MPLPPKKKTLPDDVKELIAKARTVVIRKFNPIYDESTVQHVMKSIEKKIITNLPCHLLVDIVIKALEIIPMNEKEANFVLKASQLKLNCENSRYFLSTIALHLKYQYLFGTAPSLEK